MSMNVNAADSSRRSAATDIPSGTVATKNPDLFAGDSIKTSDSDGAVKGATISIDPTAEGLPEISLSGIDSSSVYTEISSQANANTDGMSISTAQSNIVELQKDITKLEQESKEMKGAQKTAKMDEITDKKNELMREEEKINSIRTKLNDTLNFSKKELQKQLTKEKQKYVDSMMTAVLMAYTGNKEATTSVSMLSKSGSLTQLRSTLSAVIRQNDANQIDGKLDINTAAIASTGLAAAVKTQQVQEPNQPARYQASMPTSTPPDAGNSLSNSTSVAASVASFVHHSLTHVASVVKMGNLQAFNKA